MATFRSPLGVKQWAKAYINVSSKLFEEPQNLGAVVSLSEPTSKNYREPGAGAQGLCPCS